MSLAERAGVTVDQFINDDIITTDHERNFISRLSRKQRQTYKVDKFVHLYDSVFGGKQKENLKALNQFCVKEGYKPYKSTKTISNILKKERNFKEFEPIE